MPLFVFDDAFMDGRAGANRRAFLAEALTDLRESLRALGGDDPEIDLFQAWPRGIAMIIDEERCIRCNLCVERCPTNCITMDRLELERLTPDGKVLLESYKDNVLGQIGQEAGMAVQR